MHYSILVLHHIPHAINFCDNVRSWDRLTGDARCGLSIFCDNRDECVDWVSIGLDVDSKNSGSIWHCKRISLCYKIEIFVIVKFDVQIVLTVIGDVA